MMEKEWYVMDRRCAHFIELAYIALLSLTEALHALKSFTVPTENLILSINPTNIVLKSGGKDIVTDW